MVSVGDKALLFRNRDMMWLEESGSPSVGDKGFLVRNEDGNFFLKGTSVSVGNKGRLFNINGVNYLRSEISALGALKWSVNLSDVIHGVKTISDGTIIVGSEDGVHAINSDGSIKWTNKDPYNAVNCPTCCPTYFTDVAISSDETKLFVGDTCAFLRCFNVANGTEVWNWSDPYGAVGSDFWGGIVLDSYDNVYGSGRFGIVSVNKDGNFRWDNSSMGEYDSRLDVDDTRLYVCQRYDGTYSGYSALYKDTGLMAWYGGTELGYDVYYYNHKVYFGTGNEVVCTNQDGSENWSYGIDNGIYGIITDTDENCYFQEWRGNYPNYSNCIKKIDENGNLVWEKNIGSLSVTYPLRGTRKFAMDGNNLYFSTWDTNNYVFALKKSNGITNWSYSIPSDSVSGADLSPSNDAYYFGVGNYLYALET